MTIYYVSKTGNNNNTGTSASTPWLTITKAANTIQAGDTVNVMTGNYNERVIPQNSGNSTNPITYKPYGTYPNYDIVTIDGNGFSLSNYQAMVEILGNYIIFDGFSLNGSNGGAGIKVSEDDGIAPSNNVTIKNNRLIGPFYWGAIRTGNSSRCNNLIVHNNHIESSTTNPTEGIEQISLSMASNFTVSNNYIQNIGTNPLIPIDIKDICNNGNVFNNIINMTSNDGGIYFNAATNVNVYNNEVYGADNGINLAIEVGTGGVGDTIDTINIFNNLFHDTHWGIWIAGYGSGTIQNITIENNTIANNTANLEAGNAPGIVINNLIIRNNIFYNGSYEGVYLNISNISGFDLEYNNYYNASSTPAGTNNVNGNPLFVNLTNKDYHLQSTSPCIDRGKLPTTNARLFDKDNVGRPQGIGYDIGAYEYYTGTICDIPTCDFRIF